MGDVAGTVDDPIEIDIEHPEFRRALRKKYRELDVEVNGTRATASSPHQRCEQDVGTSQRLTHSTRTLDSQPTRMSSRTRRKKRFRA